MNEVAGGFKRIAVVDHHFADYTINLAEALQMKADVGLALSVEGLRELTATQSRKLDRYSRFVEYDTRTKIGEIIALWRIMRLILSFKPELVIIHENGQLHSFILIAMMRLFCAVYLIVHDPSPHSGVDARAARKQAWRIAAERRLASACVVHGEYCAQALRAKTAKPVISIPHGPILRDESIATPDRQGQQFLIFGRMQHYKGVDVAIEAFSALSAEFPQATLRLAGRGPELRRLASDIEMLGERVIVHDEFVTPEDLIRYMALSSAIVLPYRNATQSGVVAAAFANGRAVIVSDVGAIGEVVTGEYNGLLIEPASVNGLKSAMRRVLSEAGLRERLENGVAETRPKVAWDVAASILSQPCFSSTPAFSSVLAAGQRATVG